MAPTPTLDHRQMKKDPLNPGIPGPNLHPSHHIAAPHDIILDPDLGQGHILEEGKGPGAGHITEIAIQGHGQDHEAITKDQDTQGAEAVGGLPITEKAERAGTITERAAAVDTEVVVDPQDIPDGEEERKHPPCPTEEDTLETETIQSLPNVWVSLV